MNGQDEKNLPLSRYDWWKRSAFPVVLAALLGTLGGGPGYRFLDNPREHPFTSEDWHARAAVLEDRAKKYADITASNIKGDNARLAKSLEILGTQHQERMNRMEVRQAGMAALLADKPPRKLLERVTRVEEHMKYLERSCVKWAGVQKSRDD